MEINYKTLIKEKELEEILNKKKKKIKEIKWNQKQNLLINYKIKFIIVGSYGSIKKFHYI